MAYTVPLQPVPGLKVRSSVLSVLSRAMRVLAVPAYWVKVPLIRIFPSGWMASLGRAPAVAAPAGWQAVRGPARAVLAGGLWVGWPCGLLQGALLVASMTGGPASGAAAMAAFAVASSPGLLLAP